MVSNIDPTKPQTGLDQPVKVIRDNFSAAKSEIEDLQSRAAFGNAINGIPLLPSRTQAELMAMSPATLPAGLIAFCSTVGTIVYTDGANWCRVDNDGNLTG